MWSTESDGDHCGGEERRRGMALEQCGHDNRTASSLVVLPLRKYVVRRGRLLSSKIRNVHGWTIGGSEVGIEVPGPRPATSTASGGCTGVMPDEHERPACHTISTLRAPWRHHLLSNVLCTSVTASSRAAGRCNHVLDNNNNRARLESRLIRHIIFHPESRSSSLLGEQTTPLLQCLSNFTPEWSFYVETSTSQSSALRFIGNAGTLKPPPTCEPAAGAPPPPTCVNVPPLNHLS